MGDAEGYGICGRQFLFCLRDQERLSSHIGLEDLGDFYAAIGLEIVFQEGDEHAGRGHTGVVEGVGQIIFPILSPDADFQPPGLGVA